MNTTSVVVYRGDDEYRIVRTHMRTYDGTFVGDVWALYKNGVYTDYTDAWCCAVMLSQINGGKYDVS